MLILQDWCKYLLYFNMLKNLHNLYHKLLLNKPWIERYNKFLIICDILLP